jgi:hypothetical protein
MNLMSRPILKNRSNQSFLMNLSYRMCRKYLMNL